MEGDRDFDRLAADIDAMAGSYTAYASREAVERETENLELILAELRRGDGEGRASDATVRVAVQLARLLGPCGRYERVIEILGPLVSSGTTAEVLLELGYALCRHHRQDPLSPDYERAQRYLSDALENCRNEDYVSVPDLRKQTSLLARAHSRFAWTWEAKKGREEDVLTHYRLAAETEPSNPYHLANLFGFELYCHPNAPLAEVTRPALRQARNVCVAHAQAGTELPYALFTGGRLSLLLGENSDALGWYARGVRYLFEGLSCVSEDTLEDELQWIRRLHFGGAEREEHAWIRQLIELAPKFRHRAPRSEGDAGSKGAPESVLIIAGGAASMPENRLKEIEPVLKSALASFSGLLIAGGTQSGIPGCVGKIAKELESEGRKNFHLACYLPKRLPHDVPKDDRYDEHAFFGEDFSPSQILAMWSRFCDEGRLPEHVSVLGFGGGDMTAAEFRLAFAFGATVAAVQGTGGAADEILNDPVWGLPRT